MAYNSSYGQYDDEQQQQHRAYGHPQSAPYAAVGNASTYSVNNGSTPGFDLSAGQGGAGMGYHDMYDDGERSPLTANAQGFAGYPPSHGGGGGPNSHPGMMNASQPSLLAKDPYNVNGQHGNGYEIPQDYPLVPPAGFGAMRPSYSPSGRADSDVEWQKRARMPTRGKTTRIKLTNEGNFIHEYPVPGPVRNSVEAKWMAMCAWIGASASIWRC